MVCRLTGRVRVRVRHYTAHTDIKLASKEATAVWQETNAGSMAEKNKRSETEREGSNKTSERKETRAKCDAGQNR
jgi:hypothetical protein